MKTENDIDRLFKDKLTSGEHDEKLNDWNAENAWANYETAHPKKTNLWRTVLSAAAILVPIGFAVFLMLKNDVPTLQYASNNQLETILLPNGTEVWLNKNSSLTIAVDFETNPMVNIIGEAYFTVKNKLIIKTEKAVFEANASSFNLKNRPDESKTECIVDAGAVSMYSIEAKNLVLKIEPNNFCEINNLAGLVTMGENDNQNYLAWKTGILKFEDTPYATVAEIIESQYNVKVEFENENTQYCTVSGTFDNESLKTIIKKLNKTGYTEIVKSGKHLVVKGDGC